MILFLKSLDDDGDNKMPLHEKLILIFKDRVKEAEDDQDLARAKRDLAKLQGGASDYKNRARSTDARSNLGVFFVHSSWLQPEF